MPIIDLVVVQGKCQGFLSSDYVSIIAPQHKHFYRMQVQALMIHQRFEMATASGCR
jgi:hypothetical protein